MRRVWVSLLLAACFSLVIEAPAGSESVQAVVSHRIVVPRSALLGYLPLRPPDPIYSHLPAQRAGKMVVVDISDFMLYELVDGIIVKRLQISTGFGGPFRELHRLPGGQYELETGHADTHRGAFEAHRQKVDGYDGELLHMGPGGTYTSKLGVMSWPVWFYGTIDAIHGEDVPNYNASHGCVRIPWQEAKPFYDWTPDGTPIVVQQ